MALCPPRGRREKGMFLSKPLSLTSASFRWLLGTGDSTDDRTDKSLHSTELAW